MNLTKQYIIQCFVIAANNLRLSSEKIEVVAILRDHFAKSGSVINEISKMKKVTELSRFAIKLNDIYNYIEHSKVDFLKVSEKFKEHAFSLVKEFSYVLDVVTPPKIKEILINFSQQVQEEIDTIENVNTDAEKNQETLNSDKKAKKIKILDNKRDELREKFVMEDLFEDGDFNFEKYERTIIKPVKTLDALINRLEKYDYTPEEMSKFIAMMRFNAQLSKKVGFDMLANMHNIFSRGLYLIDTKDLYPSKEVIEALRACLIVIVAVVRGKEVDLTTYLNKAENFGNKVLRKK